MIVPAGVPGLSVRPPLNLLSLPCEVLVHCQWTVGVVGWHIVGDRSARDSQCSAHYTNKGFLNFIQYNFIFTMFALILFSLNYVCTVVNCSLHFRVAGSNLQARALYIFSGQKHLTVNVNIDHWDIWTKHWAFVATNPKSGLAAASPSFLFQYHRSKL